MKRWMCALLCAMLVVLAVGASAEGTLLDDIIARGQLVVGVEATFPPFESYDAETGTEIVGFDIDLCRAIAEDLGVELVIKDMEFSGIVPSVQNKMIDLAPCITRTDERALVVDFTQEYTGSKLGVVIRADDDSIATLDDLKQKRVCVQLGSLADRQLTLNGVTTKGFNKHDEALLAVKNNVEDAHVLDGTVGNQYAQSLGGLKVIEIPELNAGVPGLSIIVPMGEDALLERVNAIIARMNESGDMAALRTTWNLFD